MSWQLDVRPRALDDIVGAKGWYEEQRRGLGERFLDDAFDAMRKAVASPFQYPVIFRRTRRTALSRFPYAVYYRVKSETVVVVAVVHLRRHPRVWQVREAPAAYHPDRLAA